MSDDWDFYQCLVEDRPASIMVDMGLWKDTPVAAYPDLVNLRVYLRAPTPEGLTTNAEADILYAIEDDLKSVLAGAALYVGRNTTAGFRDFACYASNGAACEKLIRKMMEAHPAYRFETGSRSDTQWDVYRNFLYPTHRTRQIMTNRGVYDALVGDGDDLSKPRDVDHWIYFRSSYERSIFVADCAAKGFAMRCLHEPNEISDKFGVQVFREDTPEKLDEVVLQLFDMAVDAGGTYDGWETQVQS